MCYKGKCLYCIPVENGCLALAIISAVVTGLVLLACIVMGALTAAGAIFVTSQIQQSHSYYGSNDYEYRTVSTGAVTLAGIAIGFVLALLAVASLIAFIFSVLLCNGICKRRPGQVLAYFIYGVVITVLTVIASVAQMVNNYDTQPGLMGLFGCVVYSLFLVLVHQTYTKIRDGAVFKDHHIRLVES